MYYSKRIDIKELPDPFHEGKNLLLDISAALSTTKTFVLGLNSRSTEDGFAIIRIEIQIKDGAQLSTLMNKLHQISGVLQVNRPVG